MNMAASQGRGVHSCSNITVPLESTHRKDQRKSITDVDQTPLVKVRTMESVRSTFHTQLATVMDSLLAAAVCEIAKIFESSLCEQQAALVQKTEEICVLRDKLEKVEKKQKTKTGEGDVTSEERCDSSRQRAVTASGPTVQKDVSSHSDIEECFNQSKGGLKVEVTGQNGGSVKHEAGPRPSLSVPLQAVEGSLATQDQRQMDSLSATQAKAKVSHWDEGSHGADHRPIQDQSSTSFLSISQSGRCSSSPDTGLTQPREWLPGLEAGRGLKTLQTDGTSSTAHSSTGTDTPCFQSGFGSEETSNEDDDNTFPFLDHEPENQNLNHNSVQGQIQELGQTEDRQDQSQTSSQWRPRDDRGGRATTSNTRRVMSLGLRDPLRPQSNSQLHTLRHTNSLGHPPAPGGGNGRPYTCPYCSKCFTYPSHQRRHLLRHTGVRLHPCQFCDKSFLTPSELTVHTRTHTGERPFACAQCGKRFARSGNLRAHQRDVHMGKRPFSCTECGKRFAHRGNLRVHNHRVHQGDPYYMEDQQEAEIGPNPI
ncbi:zinc finger protein 37-like isoform X4 [Cynoglossus semilaevis]|uniref:zinc finger protein 37-like isoform X4 n=1 Tax=Cynoglossus semilaevis TaxID=244447 RepID=UPI000D623AEB|nr:zinc finger protein 37-like isoform X4 [Cynoglossus semilaevis]